MDSINNSLSQKKPLNIMFMLIVISSILVVSTLVYGIIKYVDYNNFKKVVCDEHIKLKKNINVINKNNELLKNKKRQFSDYLSKNYEDINAPCIGEWSECDNDCQQIYSVIKSKNGNGKDCEFEDGKIRECINEGDCSPINCSGNWSKCNENNNKIYSVNIKSKRGGIECEAEEGAIDRTSCPRIIKLDTGTGTATGTGSGTGSGTGTGTGILQTDSKIVSDSKKEKSYIGLEELIRSFFITFLS